MLGLQEAYAPSTIPNPSLIAFLNLKVSYLKKGEYREDIVDLQLHFQLYLTKMDLEEEKPTGKLCTPTKLSGCENDANKTQPVQHMQS